MSHKHDKKKHALDTLLNSRPKEADDDDDGAKHHENQHIETLYEETQNQETKHNVQGPIMQVPEEKEDLEAGQAEGKEVTQEEGEGEGEGEAEVEVVKEVESQELEDVETFDSSTELDSILRRAPVIIFSKTYCPYSATAKHILLEEFKLTPSPYIVELDLHPHGKELQVFLEEKTGRGTVPNVLVNGKSLGGGDELEEFRAEGGLVSILRSMGGKRLGVEQVNLEQ